MSIDIPVDKDKFHERFHIAVILKQYPYFQCHCIQETTMCTMFTNINKSLTEEVKNFKKNVLQKCQFF